MIRQIANPLFLREQDLRETIELMFFAYRDLITRADLVLQDYGLGRAHHRALYFTGKHPGIKVGDLLLILQVTKQSLARVLRELEHQGFIRRSHGSDGRIRCLYLTRSGQNLEAELTRRQCQLISEAYRKAGGEAVDGFRKVMIELAQSQVQFERQIKPQPSPNSFQDHRANGNPNNGNPNNGNPNNGKHRDA
ncbi:MAG: MarR family transcriptional regulator [Pseudomonadota bacterium]